MRHACFATLIILAAALTPSEGRTQDSSARDRWADSAQQAIETAYRVGDVPQLRAARAMIERALTVHERDPLLEHFLAHALYREASLVQGMGDAKAGRALLEAAEPILERSAKRLPLPETHALRASVLGQLIGTNPLKGMTLGPRSNAAMERAIELGPTNPRVWLLRGIGAIFTPSMFGGGEERAERYLRRAIELFESDAATAPYPSWGHAEAWLWLGQVHGRQHRVDDARRAYARALELEPDNAYVLRVLLPALERDGR